MKIIKNNNYILAETNEAFSASQYPIAVQKMRDFNNNLRKENLKACGNQKLIDYYDICVRYSLNHARSQIENELRRKGLSQYIRPMTGQSTTTPTPTPTPAAQASTPITLSHTDFSLLDARTVKDNASNPKVIIDNAVATTGSTKKICIYLILALVLDESAVVDACKTFLLTNIGMPTKELGRIVQTVSTDPAMVEKLGDIKQRVAFPSQPQSYTQAIANATADITVKAQPGAPMYRLVTYNKDYNPPARQYLLIRKLDHTTNKYHVGIEGSPRNTGDWAEPVFDSIQQAEDFAKNVINLQTARNVANFKYSIVSKPFTGGTADLSDCTLVDTILGPAYIQNKSSYKESLEEDTKKIADHKWVNKGDEGTHGEFKTKKEADAQRKAMFANGYHEDLNEDIEKHDTLNPKLWNDDNTLKPEVKEKIMQIAEDFCKGLEEDEIKFNLKDIKLVGSNCSYNYNKDSDLDIHLVMETGSLQCPDNLYPLLYSAYRSIYNNKLDIDFYGIPVELYIETDETQQLDAPVTEARQQTALKSNGIYSVMNDAWIKEPVAEDIPEIDKEAFEKEFKVWEDEAKELLDDSKENLDESLLESKEIKKYITDNKEKVGKYILQVDEDKKEVYIDMLDIYDEYQHKGFGTKALTDIINEYKNKDYNLIWAWVDTDNTPAINLYKKLGKVSDKEEDGEYKVIFYQKDELNESREEDILKARSIIADQIRGEWDADKGYTKAAADLAELDEIDTDSAQKTLLDIASEEHVHVGELETVYDAFDPNLFDELEDGHTEVDNDVEPANALDYDIADEPIAEGLDLNEEIRDIDSVVPQLRKVAQDFENLAKNYKPIIVCRNYAEIAIIVNKYLVKDAERYMNQAASQNGLKAVKQAATTDKDYVAILYKFTWADPAVNMVKVREDLTESAETDKIEQIEDYIERLYDLRKQTLANEGEYGIGNLVFKEIRNKGYFDKLWDLKHELKSKEFSLEEAWKNTETAEIGEIEKELGQDLVLFKPTDGKKYQVEKAKLTKIDDVPNMVAENILNCSFTDSFIADLTKLVKSGNTADLDYFFKENSGISALMKYGFDWCVNNGKISFETMANNAKTQSKNKNGHKVYALIKGKGSGNPFRPYFYKENGEAVFVKCRFKKQTENSAGEYNDIATTANYVETDTNAKHPFSKNLIKAK